MSHVPHELAEEFPDRAGTIHALKLSDRRFAKLVDDYHEVNRAVHRLEARIEAASEDREIELRKERLRLKDEIARMLIQEAA